MLYLNSLFGKLKIAPQLEMKIFILQKLFK